MHIPSYARSALFAVSFVALGGLAGCGNGCSSLEPTPGGFPSNLRTANAAQVRISDTGLAAISADPAALVGGLLGGMGLAIDVPASCGGNPAVCCPGGNPVSPCGPVTIDLTLQPGDLPRLEIRPAQGASRLDVVLRARLKTAMDIPVKIPVVGDCGIAIDTAPGPNADIKIDLPVGFPQDAQAGTTRVDAGAVTLSQLTTQDVNLTGGFACQLANLGLSFFLNTLSGTFESAIRDAINQQTCKACPSGTTNECGPFATACTDNVCTKADNTCVQELGIAGRLNGASLLGSISPATQGKADIYDVAGGYATTNNNGLALGLLGGARPAGTPRDRCGPAATAPARVVIPQSAFFQGNTRPDTGAPFGLAFGYHKSQLDELMYSMYDGGILCITATTATVPQLTTDTLALLSRSLGDLTTQTGAVALGLRPQAPPTIVLGLNTFKDNGGMQVVDEPLLDITFKGLELDFFAQVESQYIRIFTVVTDLHLPLGMQIGTMGDLVPVFGDLKNAFTNVTVKNSEALAESPAAIAANVPTLLELALPGLAGGLGGFELPQLGGLAIKVKAITAVDNKQFLAIFADFAPAAMAAQRVQVQAQLNQVSMPTDAELMDPKRWNVDGGPMAELDLATLDGAAGDHEWAWRIDDGLWSAWSSSSKQTVRARTLWVPGIHRIEVIARRRGEPNTTSLTPAMLTLSTETDAMRRRNAARAAQAESAGFHGQAGANGGCSCQSNGQTSSGSDPWIIGLAFVVLGGRTLRRTRRKVNPGAIFAALVLCGALFVQSCSCGSNPCGSQECMPGELISELGRHNSLATDGTRTIAATYDVIYGDLVMADIAPDQTRTLYSVDGVPDGTPMYDPSTYRGGVADPGADVGWWTSAALYQGKARIAYYDRDNAALKFAIEESKGKFRTMTVEDDAAIDIGAYASLSIDNAGVPAIAYLATNVPGAAGALGTELRLARATTATPGESDWTMSVIARSEASCAGACGAGTVCIVSPTAAPAQACAAPTTDCAAACGTGQACVAAMCREVFAEPAVPDMPTGSGLFVNLLSLADGRLAAVYYDRNRTALVIAVENGVGASQFTETMLDDNGDRGMWASAIADGNTVHIAYQDALIDAVYYTTYNGAAGMPQLVDDGTRVNDRAHPVGASATMLLRSGLPTVMYQDGMNADVMMAQPSGATTWMPSTFASGVPLDGFYIAGASGTVVWGTLDHTTDPIMNLTVKSVP